MMLFDSTVRKDLARTFAATLVVILTIVITMFLIRTLSQAAGGAVSPQDVVLLLGYTALGYLPTMLALSLFVAIVVTLGRMYRDSEMVIWLASGVSVFRFVRPVLWTAAPVLLVVLAAMAILWPWVNRQSTELRERYAQRSDLSRVTPGVFQSSADGRRVFFVERESPDGINARNVFILTQQKGVESVTSARSGRLEAVGGDRFLVLEKGQRHESAQNTSTASTSTASTSIASTSPQDSSTQNSSAKSAGEYSLSSFESYRILVDEATVRNAEARPPKAMWTTELLRAPSAQNWGELTWRLGLVLATANLLLLGIGLAATNPRRPGNWNLIFALLTFIVYFNLVTLSQGWVSSGRLGIGPALLGLHGAMFTLAMALLWWRSHGTTFNWRQSPQRRAA